MPYLVKTPWLFKKIFPFGTWELPAVGKKIYLTFDDGPHPAITHFVLNELDIYNAKATFFCIGKNVVEHPDVYDEIRTRGHAVGNHTQNHLNGWKTSDEEYVANIRLAKRYIQSDLFRPPYGRIRSSQYRLIDREFPGTRVIMWNVLSADFDVNIDAERCTNNVLKHAAPGSIIVFHDSEKAFPRLEHSLPVVLKRLKENGFEFEAIT
jgi:peptidoglycan-N-acetylglucosamine deacetylase